MKRLGSATAPWLLLLVHTAASARGVTPYLPLNLEPEIEAQIERVLILAGKPVMRRPIAAATVLDALPRACAVDRVLCERVGRYLARYTHYTALTHASVEGAATHGADTVLPDRYGLHNRSAWDASLTGYIQPSDYLLVNLGGVAYDGRQSFTGSYLSAGFSKMQLDIGYKPHWFSPLTDSSMLMSTEAPTMPSVSLSNYEPLTRLGLSYEFFEARMSKSDRIVWQNGFTSGYPRLGGIQLSMEPVSGWSLGLNRLVQFGGGALQRHRQPVALLQSQPESERRAEGCQSGGFGHQQLPVSRAGPVRGLRRVRRRRHFARQELSTRQLRALVGNSLPAPGAAVRPHARGLRVAERLVRAHDLAGWHDQRRTGRQ
jgi:hypothetical protein